MSETVNNVIVICVDTYRKDFLRIYESKNPILEDLRIEDSLSDFIKKHGNTLVHDKFFPVSYPTVQFRRDFFEGIPYWKYGYFEPIPENAETLAGRLSDSGTATQCITDVPHYMRFNLFQGFQGIEWIAGHPVWSETKGNYMGLYNFPEQVPLKYNEQFYRYVAKPTRAKYRSLTRMDKPFHEEVLNSAERWLKGYRKMESKPFMLWVDIWEPHEPWTYRIDGGEVELDDPIYVNADYYSPEQNKEILNMYSELHRKVSDSIASFIEEIYRMGFLEDTLLFLFSDHGYSLGEHGKFGKLPSRDTLIRKLPDDYLWGLFEEEIGVPFIVFCPESIKASDLKIKGIITPFEVRETILFYLDKKNQGKIDIFNSSFEGLESSIVIPAGNPAGDFNRKKQTLDYRRFGFTIIEDYGMKRTVFFGEQSEFMHKYNIEFDPYQLKPEVLRKFNQEELDIILNTY